MMNEALAGQKILVTGASKGIGYAIAELLLQQGAIVGLHYRSSQAAVIKLQEQYGTEQAILIHSDLAEKDGASLLFDNALKALKSLDSLVINAGVFTPHPVGDPLETWIEIWDQTIQVNLTAAGVLTKKALEYFKKIEQGRIIYIGSRAAFRGETEEYLAYAASKGGLTSLSKSVARSFGKYNIKSFVIAPGFTRTEMALEAISKIGEDQVLKNIALNRLTTPEDIAPLVAFMCTGKMDHATGTTIDLNAGSHIR